VHLLSIEPESIFPIKMEQPLSNHRV